MLAALLRNHQIRIGESGAGSDSIADIMVQWPACQWLVAHGTVTVPTRNYPLSRETWTR